MKQSKKPTAKTVLVVGLSLLIISLIPVGIYGYTKDIDALVITSTLSIIVVAVLLVEAIKL